MSDIYAQIAVLSRVTAHLDEQGVEPSGQEKYIAETFCTRAAGGVRQNLGQIENRTTTTGWWRSRSSRSSVANTDTPSSRIEYRRLVDARRVTWSAAPRTGSFTRRLGSESVLPPRPPGSAVIAGATVAPAAFPSLITAPLLPAADLTSRGASPTFATRLASTVRVPLV